jgi:uncharacterized membrane protein
MRIAVATEVEAPRRVVWSYLTRRESWREFMDGLECWQIQDEGRRGVGARFAMRMQLGFIELGGIVEIVEFDPPCDIAWTAVTGVDQRGRWRLRALDDARTHVELRVTYHASGGLVALIADRLALPTVRGHLERSLSELRRRVEALPLSASGRAKMPPEPAIALRRG